MTLDGCRHHQVLHCCSSLSEDFLCVVLPTTLGGTETLDGCGHHQVLHSSQLRPLQGGDCLFAHRVATNSWWHCNPRWFQIPSGAALVADPSLAGRRLRVANYSWWCCNPRWLRTPSGAALVADPSLAGRRLRVANYSWWHCNPRWLRTPLGAALLPDPSLAAWRILFCMSCCQLLLVALQPSMVADATRCCTRHIVLPTTFGGAVTLDGCGHHQVLHSSQLRLLQGGNCVFNGCGCHQVLHSSKLRPLCRGELFFACSVANCTWWHCNPR